VVRPCFSTVFRCTQANRGASLFFRPAAGRHQHYHRRHHRRQRQRRRRRGDRQHHDPQQVTGKPRDGAPAPAIHAEHGAVAAAVIQQNRPRLPSGLLRGRGVALWLRGAVRQRLGVDPATRRARTRRLRLGACCAAVRSTTPAGSRAARPATATTPTSATATSGCACACPHRFAADLWSLCPLLSEPLPRRRPAPAPLDWCRPETGAEAPPWHRIRRLCRPCASQAAEPPGGVPRQARFSFFAWCRRIPAQSQSLGASEGLIPARPCRSITVARMSGQGIPPCSTYKPSSPPS
jgi:hypothetical protein